MRGGDKRKKIARTQENVHKVCNLQTLHWRCSAFVRIRETRMKTIMRIHCIPTILSMFYFFKEKRKKEMWPHYVPEGFRAIETLIHCKFECKMVQPLWKLLASYRDEHGSLWDPTIPHLEIYLKEMKICVHTETCHLECRAVLLLYLRNSQIILIWINLKNFILEGDVSELTNPRIL